MAKVKTARVGTAAWSIPKEYREKFLKGESLLESYARSFSAVEINTSFYRDHKTITYQRWAASVPEQFKFAVKLSKILTHVQKLEVGDVKFKDIIGPVMNLGANLGCILVQLPPSLQFNLQTAQKFFDEVRAVYHGPVALEMRHISWRSDAAIVLMKDLKLSPVTADPEVHLLNELVQEVNSDFRYYRLHGSPEIYKSSYDEDALRNYSEQIRQQKNQDVWCIFDNTTFGHATGNAITLQSLLEKGSGYEKSSKEKSKDFHHRL